MPTSLIDLSRPFDVNGTLLAKLELENPTGSVKDRPVARMLTSPEAAEATGGNTGISLARAGRDLGKRVITTMSTKMSPGKVTAMRAAGAEVVLCPPVGYDDQRHFIHVARRIGARDGHWFMDQFTNVDNVAAHHETTGMEIVQQAGRLDCFVAGAGTGGTITGVARALRQAGSAAEVYLADPSGSILAAAARGRAATAVPYLVEGIGGDFLPPLLDLTVIDGAYTISDQEAAAHLSRLSAAGWSAGSSSGVAIGAALAYIRDHPGSTVCTIIADDGDRYAATWQNQTWLSGLLRCQDIDG